MISFGEETLRTAIQNFVLHHSERDHQGLANHLISQNLATSVI
jgi:hypothetical protein